MSTEPVAAPAPDDSDASESDGSFEDWKSDAEEKEPCVCLFCSVVAIPRLILRHCLSDHDFDVMGLLKAKGAGDYHGIRLVNYCRRQVALAVPPAEVAAAAQDPSASFWESDEYLLPVLEGDSLLYSLGGAEEDEDADDATSAAASAGAGAELADPLLQVVGVAIKH